MTLLTLTKQALRLQAEALRLTIRPQEKVRAGSAALALLTAQVWFSQLKNIGLYHAFKHEFPTSLIIQAFAANNQACYLPRVQEQSAFMDFSLYEGESRLIKNRYGILEPPDYAPTCPIEQLDVIILPLLGFDMRGNRLGAGGGYYDKALVSGNNKNKPLLIGLAYACQEFETIPMDPWDIKLNAVLTEKQMIVF